jgi:ribonucleoside-diphosphate reductase alpha chain
MKDPLARLMVEQGFPHEKNLSSPNQWVFSFPVKSPDGAITRNDMTAIESLDIWKCYQDHWCEHKPSCTVNIRDHEWMEVGAWVYRNFDEVSGVSFLPYSGHTYKQAPYQEISEREYQKAAKGMPSEVDWNRLKEFEDDDNTAGAQTFACTGDSCEVVDLESAE